jgi:hypothetical protein
MVPHIVRAVEETRLTTCRDLSVKSGKSCVKKSSRTRLGSPIRPFPAREGGLGVRPTCLWLSRYRGRNRNQQTPAAKPSPRPNSASPQTSFQLPTRPCAEPSARQSCCFPAFSLAADGPDRLLVLVGLLTLLRMSGPAPHTSGFQRAVVL